MAAGAMYALRDFEDQVRSDLTIHPSQIVAAAADGKKSAIYLTPMAYNILGSDVAEGLYFDGPLWDFVNELNGE